MAEDEALARHVTEDDATTWQRMMHKAPRGGLSWDGGRQEMNRGVFISSCYRKYRERDCSRRRENEISNLTAPL